MEGFDDIVTTLEGAAIALVILFIFLAIVCIAFAVFAIIGRWKLFVKAGEPGWKSIIPFYNTYTLVDMAGLNWYWAVLASLISLTIPALGSTACNVLACFAEAAIAYNVGKKLNKSSGWFVLAFFFGFILYPIAGYSKNAVWDKSAKVTPNAFFDKK